MRIGDKSRCGPPARVPWCSRMIPQAVELMSVTATELIHFPILGLSFCCSAPSDSR